MKFIVVMSAFLSMLLCNCTHRAPMPPKLEFVRMLEDTTGNRRAKWDLMQLQHYTNICKAIGIRPLYDGTDSFEVRMWRQFSFFGMGTDEEIYSLSVLDTSVTLRFYRVYCRQANWETEDFKHWDPFTQPVIDSFFAISKSFPTKIAKNLRLEKLWDLKTQSALHISDKIGFLDGAVNSIELASPSKYKLIRYHEAQAYYEKTGMKDIKYFIDSFDELINVFQSHRVYE